jgi:uncharacterized protein
MLCKPVKENAMSNDQFRSNVELVRELCRRLSSGDFDGAAAIMAEDLRHEAPFTPAGPPMIRRGKAAFREILDQVLPGLQGWSVHITTLYPTVDPSWVVAEGEGRGIFVATGAPYENRYVWIFKFADGKVAEWKEYANPLPLMTLLTPDVGVNT